MVVEAVSGEPVSADFPVQQGKTGKSPESGQNFALTYPLTDCFRCHFSPNSLARGTGNFLTGTGKIWEETGNLKSLFAFASPFDLSDEPVKPCADAGEPMAWPPIARRCGLQPLAVRDRER